MGTPPMAGGPGATNGSARAVDAPAARAVGSRRPRGARLLGVACLAACAAVPGVSGFAGAGEASSPGHPSSGRDLNPTPKGRPATSAPATQAAEIHLHIFLSKTCTHCELVEEPALKQLSAKHGCRIVPHYYDVDDLDEYKRLVVLERRMNDTGNELPVVVVGDSLLGGTKEVAERLDRLVMSLRRTGSPPVRLPTMEEGRAAFLPPTSRAAPAGGAMHLAYFDQPGCRDCARTERIIGLAEARYPTLKVRRFYTDRRDDQLLLEALCERAGVARDRRLLVPAIFVGRDALIREDVEDAALERLCARYATEGSPVTWEVAAAERSAAEGRLAQRARSVTVLAVVVGGLVDGVNPCAFATLVFFVCCLARVGGNRRLTILAGTGFSAGVFASYLLIGTGLSEALRWVDLVPWASASLTWLIIGGTIVLGALSFRDFALAARGRLRQMALVLPERVRLRINALIAKRLRGRSVLGAALGLGFLISLLEFVCTGQVYLPLIRYMTSASGSRLRGYALLLVYNSAFIAPLLGVFAATYFGLSSQRLQTAFQRHVALSKFALGVFFLGLGTILLHFHLSQTV